MVDMSLNYCVAFCPAVAGFVVNPLINHLQTVAYCVASCSAVAVFFW